MIELRPYQLAAKAAINSEWDSGRKRTLLVLPTGTGKTIAFSSVIGDKVKSGGKALIIAGREELLNQAADKLLMTTGLPCSFEKAGKRSNVSDSPCTVASVQTLSRPSRLKRFDPHCFSHIVVDEAHHALAKSYKAILNHFPDAYVLGCTATPDRGDRKSLSEVFDSVAYEYSLREAVNDGYLCPIKVKMLPVKLDISNVSIKAGDYSADEIGESLDPYLEAIAKAMAENCRERKTVVFLPLVSTAKKFCEILNTCGLKAVEIDGETKNRGEILKAYESGEYNVICNSMLLTEGWDSPRTDCVVVLRPTKVRSLYSQMIGRGTRIYPGKKDLLVLDFLWLTDRHDICGASSLLCKNPEVAEKMDELVSDGGEYDILDAEQMAENAVVEDRERALAYELEIMRKRKTKLVDPLQYAYSIAAEDLANYVPTFEWEMLPATEKQLEILENRGISTGGGMNAGMASLIIDRLFARRKAGLSTPRQIRFLENAGFRHVGTWPFKAASDMISIISMNGWKVPYGMNPAAYTP